MTVKIKNLNKKGFAPAQLALLILGLFILLVMLYIVFRSQEGSFELIDKIKELLF